MSSSSRLTGFQLASFVQNKKTPEFCIIAEAMRDLDIPHH